MRHLSDTYTIQHGDCLASIAMAYGRAQREWETLKNLNLMVLVQVQWKLTAGMVIKIPKDWLPIRSQGYAIKKWNGIRADTEAMGNER